MTFNPVRPDTGIYHGLTNEVYHASAGYSRSRLKILLDGTPLDFAEAPPVEETAAMRLGTATHLAILEPGEFAARVRPQPKWDLRTNAGKQAKAEWLEANPGAIGIPQQDYDDAREVARLVRTKRGPATALREGKAEASMWWTQDGVLVKSRPDFLDLDRGLSVDVKTTSRGLSDRQIVSIMVDQYAAMQAAMVYAGASALAGAQIECYLLVISMQPPIDMRLVRVDLSWLEYGEAQFLNALAKFNSCVASGEWPGWSDAGVTTVAMPPWLTKQADAMRLDMLAAEAEHTQ